MSSRAERLNARVAERGLDALLVTDLLNIRWLTGFTGTNGFALLGPDMRIFATDFRYTEQAAEQVPDFDRVQAPQELLAGLPDLLPGDADLRLGFDDEQLSVKTFRRLEEILDDRVELVGAAGVVEQERAVKEAEEIARIASAARLADEAFQTVVGDRLTGRTEKEIALGIEDAVRKLGGEGPSFPAIVAAGGHGALPHAVPRDVPIEADTLVVIDWGAQLDGYCSDCTRTLATGDLDDEAAEVYELVKRAQQAGLDATRPGPTGRDVDAAARRVIDEAGQGENFGHGLGHGVGLEIHEAPRLSKAGETELQHGHVVTVEPGVYVPGRFGVRIEDLVVVEEDGARILSGLPKELTTVG